MTVYAAKFSLANDVVKSIFCLYTFLEFLKINLGWLARVASMPKQIAISICRDNGEILKPWTFVTLNNEWYTYDQLYRDILDGPLTPIFDLNLACKT